MNEPLPKDLAGYQCVVEGYVTPGDILVNKFDRAMSWVDATIGLPVAAVAADVYRKIPCPKAGDHDKGWMEAAAAFGEKAMKRKVDEANLEQMVKMESGSLRKNKAGKGRFDLIPYEPLRQLAVHFEEGGKEHGDRNWELGQPLSVYINSAKRHSAQVNCKFDENHAIACCWNYFCFLQTVKWIEEGKLPEKLDDIGWIKQKQK